MAGHEQAWCFFCSQRSLGLPANVFRREPNACPIFEYFPPCLISFPNCRVYYFCFILGQLFVFLSQPSEQAFPESLVISLRAWVEDHQGWDDYENGRLFIYLIFFWWDTSFFITAFFFHSFPVLKAMYCQLTSFFC